MSNNNKMANLVYMSMLQAEDEDVAQTALELMRTIVKNGVGYQILGVAALLLTLLDRYGLNCVDVLGIADCIVFSKGNNNMTQSFKDIQLLMKTKMEIIT